VSVDVKMPEAPEVKSGKGPGLFSWVLGDKPQEPAVPAAPGISIPSVDVKAPAVPDVNVSVPSVSVSGPSVSVSGPSVSVPSVSASGPAVSTPGVSIPGLDWMLGEAPAAPPAPMAILSVVNNSVTAAPKNAGIIQKYTITAINATPEKVEEAVNSAVTSGAFTQALKNAGFPNAAATQKVTIEDRTPAPAQNPLKKTVVEVTQVRRSCWET
jgi:hypothetical protein